MTFGYSPGDVVFVFSDGRILRELEFVSERDGGKGAVCKSEGGAFVRFNPSGKQYGRGQDRGAPFIVRKVEQASLARMCRLATARDMAARAIRARAEEILKLTSEIRFGDTRAIEEAANNIRAEINKLKLTESNL